MPGSSVSRRPVAVDSTLSGWWISFSVFTGAVVTLDEDVSDVTFVGSFLSNTIFQTRPFVDSERPVEARAVTRRPRPESTM